jgi:hypothetical protein
MALLVSMMLGCASMARVQAAVAPPADHAAATPVFKSSVRHATRAELRYSWRRGCPVSWEKLRVITLTHWGFDWRIHTGRLVVRRDAVWPMLQVMRGLFERRYPIRQMRFVDAYGADDHRSMVADNTSAFNCRFVSGTTRWSMHAYGLAIDLNPVENPYVDGLHVSPPNGRPYANRTLRKRGMIRRGGRVVQLFAARGWGWGGYWSGAKDYQHFSATGR